MAFVFTDNRGRKQRAALFDAGGSPVPLKTRRWDSADTTRINEAHWQKSKDESINVPLQARLAILRTRSLHEMANNPTLAGVIETHANDVVGPIGPDLQLHTSRKRYAKDGEALWEEWWNEKADIGKRTNGPDFVKLWVRNLWPCGEFTSKIIKDERVSETEIRLRLQRIAPRRLPVSTLLSKANNVFMGIEFDQYGAPICYYISKENLTGLNLSTDYEKIEADYFIHEFIQEEDDQIRGIPWIACCLDSIGQLRDFDDFVLDAAQEAANNSSMVWTQHPDIEALEIPAGDVEIQRKQMRVLPPGYQATQMQAQQPQTNYVEYRAEKQRDIGRKVGMPLMKVRLDSSNHNYSSARFDNQVYQAGIKSLQRWIERRTLNRIVRLFLREAELLGKLGARPNDLKLEWTWPVLPHVDPTKERAAERMELEDGTQSFTAICIGKGLDPEVVAEQRKRDQQMFLDLGLPQPEWMQGKQAVKAGAPEKAEGADAKGDDKKDKEENADEDA